jgi:glucose/arabinose dehydrogenase
MTTKIKTMLSFLMFILLISCQNEEIPSQSKIEKAFPNLTFKNPVDIQDSKDETNRIFVVSQVGKIFVFQNDKNVESSSIFLDISNKVLFGGEQGLLGLTFHPDYKTNGYFYIDYTVDNPKRTIISRFKTSDNPKLVLENSEEILIEQNQPYSNHNGGQIVFGPDGYLYISFGDGGSAGDPENRAQDLTQMLGKIIRIDVNISENGKNYGIPIDNPFKANSFGYLEEIFAYGLRNTWRFSFDSTGKLWAADVGQNLWEEIDIIEKGGNYGWHVMEGFHCYNPNSHCDQSGLTMPVWEYGHNSDGGYSITGGFVYELENPKDLKGKYIYADYVSGKIWSFDLSSNSNNLVANFNGQISTFGMDKNKNLFFADYSSGYIYKFTKN